LYNLYRYEEYEYNLFIPQGDYRRQRTSIAPLGAYKTPLHILISFFVKIVAICAVLVHNSYLI